MKNLKISKISKVTISVTFVFFALFFSNNSALATYGVQTKTSKCISSALPDSACSPGAILTTDIKTICTVGYTKTVRNVSDTLKKKVFKEYDIAWGNRGNYEIDHIISLELGGSNDISNLFPESYLIKDNARIKDTFENYLHKQVCIGKMTIDEAQKEISSNWLDYYQVKVLDKSSKIITTQTTTNSKIAQPAATVSVVAPEIIKVVQPASATEPAVKKSTTGICHAKGTAYYSRTINYKAYSSISDCLASGGRIPK